MQKRMKEIFTYKEQLHEFFWDYESATAVDGYLSQLNSTVLASSM
jgi:hypothetical protein